MVSLGITRRRGRHERGSRPVPPRRFWGLLEHDLKAADGRWVDPRFEDMHDALRREYEAWRRGRAREMPPRGGADR